MTCIVSLFLAQKFEIDISKEEVKVSRKAASIPGTTAELILGDVLTLEDFLYGMMLPSGNDAAYAIAEHFSRLIYHRKRKENVGAGENELIQRKAI